MSDAILMLIIINPFAQVLYLHELMRTLSNAQFLRVHGLATLLSFGVFVVFVLVGDKILSDLFQVRLASLQIFGGLIMLVIAYRYFTVGPGSNLLYRGNISDLAPEIALPYMVGPGTIWISIRIGQGQEGIQLAGAIGWVAAVLAVNFLFILLVKRLFNRLARQKETIAGKYFAILMRTNALLIGAIAIEMILLGIEQGLIAHAERQLTGGG